MIMTKMMKNILIKFFPFSQTRSWRHLAREPSARLSKSRSWTRELIIIVIFLFPFINISNGDSPSLSITSFQMSLSSDLKQNLLITDKYDQRHRTTKNNDEINYCLSGTRCWRWRSSRTWTSTGRRPSSRWTCWRSCRRKTPRGSSESPSSSSSSAYSHPHNIL